MTRFRIKIITPAQIANKIQCNPDETILSSDSIREFISESVCDYNILIVELNCVSPSEVSDLNTSDFNDFLDKPSIILCISSRERFIQNISRTNFDWLPGKEGFSVVNKSGESLTPTKEGGRFSKLFTDYDWGWRCSFSNLYSATPLNYVSIANNITGQSVALRVDIREGKVIIIPTPKINVTDATKYAAFLRLLIDLSKEEIEELTEKEREEPDWVEKYVVSEELELRDKIKKLQNEYQTLTEAHKLLYEIGKALTKTVNSVLSEIGFNSEMREDEGTHDIEICEDDFDLVIEVTSSGDNWININKTRQLSDWCKRFETERSRKPKGILVANPYCNSELTERDEPFTKAALNQAESEGFCLMTTEQLYNIFCKFFKDEKDKNEVKKLLLSTTGLLQM